MVFPTTFQIILMPISFGLLFALMLSYWGQAAIFSYTKYSKLTTILLFSSISTLTLLLICRALDSGHLPLSNLYESLLFLSWSFLIIQFFSLIDIQSKISNKNKTGSELFIRPNCACKNEMECTSLGRAQAKPVQAGYKNEPGPNKNEVFVKAGLFVRPGCAKNKNEVVPPAELFVKTDFFAKLFVKAELVQKIEGQFTHLLGVITSPMSFLTYSFAFLNLPKEMQKSTSLVPALQSNWLMMHVTVMILSYAALLCGSILSMAFLFFSFLEERQVKESNEVLAIQTPAVLNKVSKPHFVPKQSDENFSFPSLSLVAKLDNYSYRVLSLGFPLLTVGILSGAVWANQAWGSYWSWDPKESWALITWLVFAIYLHARITKGWSGQKPAIIATLGFFVVWFCYLGVNLLGTGLHSYGWFSK